jgi:serine kinase of HPr protein (carbohydrate metabolism regulator)
MTDTSPNTPSSATETLVAATSVAIGGRAVLLTGQSGSGKSDLALRLIDRGAKLISDDYTLCRTSDSGLTAHAAPRIAGQMEVRHIGIITTSFVENVPIALVVKLDDKPERMPSDNRHFDIMGRPVSEIALNAFEPSAPIKVELALARLLGEQQ